jgi:hypothetical protein
VAAITAYVGLGDGLRCRFGCDRAWQWHHRLGGGLTRAPRWYCGREEVRQGWSKSEQLDQCQQDLVPSLHLDFVVARFIGQISRLINKIG